MERSANAVNDVKDKPKKVIKFSMGGKNYFDGLNLSSS